MKKKVDVKSLLLSNENMSKYTTFKLGGNAKFLCFPSCIDELKSVINYCKTNKEKYFILGKGSNTVFRDKGYNGVVINMSNFEKQITMDNGLVKASAGTSLFELNRFLLENSLAGFEWSFGIPGSVGGAVIMNAGAYGGEIGNYIEKVEVLINNRRRIIYRENLQFSYRYSSLQNTKNIILNVWFRLKNGDTKEIQSLQKYYYDQRKEKQPLNYPSAGSIFKRENNIIPAKIIDKLYLKGVNINGVEVSKKHSGFIVKTGDATTSDLEQLIDKIKTIVKQEEGVTLVTEIIVVGEK